MDKQNKSFFQHILNWGLIIGLAFIVLSVLLYILALQQNKVMGLVNLLLFAGLIYLAQKKYRDSIPGLTLSYGKALLVGLLSSVVASVLLVVYNYIFFKYIDPSMLVVMQEQAQLKVMDQNLSAEIEEKVLDSQARFMTAGWISVFSTLGVIFQGLLVSLITSIFSKGVTPLDEEEMEEIESE